MGLFERNKTGKLLSPTSFPYQPNGSPAAEMSGAYRVMEPGLIPVATPVPDVHPNQDSATSAYAPSHPHGSISAGDLQRHPMLMRACSHCQQESRTRTKTYPAWQTWLATVALGFILLPICWIPLVLDSCKQTDHFCVLCGNKVGQVAPFEDCCVTHR